MSRRGRCAPTSFHPPHRAQITRQAIGSHHPQLELHAGLGHLVRALQHVRQHPRHPLAILGVDVLEDLDLRARLVRGRQAEDPVHAVRPRCLARDQVELPARGAAVREFYA